MQTDNERDVHKVWVVIRKFLHVLRTMVDMHTRAVSMDPGLAHTGMCIHTNTRVTGA